MGFDGFGTSSAPASNWLSNSYASGLINIDARTQTEYGLLRSLVSIYGRRGANPDNNVAIQSLAPGVNSWFALSAAFIQFGGLTAGYAPSFFNGISSWGTTDLGTLGPGLKSTNQLAYTAAMGGGFLATVAIEDPAYTRMGYTMAQSNAALLLTAVSPSFNSVGIWSNGAVANPLQSYAGTVLPDLVGALRVQQGWGSVQLSGAVHELRGFGPSWSAVPTTLAGTTNANFISAIGSANDVITGLGYAIGAGAELNLDMLAKGDVLKLAATYAYGHNGRLFNRNTIDGVTQASTWGFMGLGSGAGFAPTLADFDTMGGTLNVVSGFSIFGSFKHFFTPAVSATLFGGYIGIDAPAAATTLRDWQYGVVGANVQYEITKGLFLSPEVYWRTLSVQSNTGNSVGAGLGTDSAVGGLFQVKRVF